MSPRKRSSGGKWVGSPVWHLQECGVTEVQASNGPWVLPSGGTYGQEPLLRIRKSTKQIHKNPLDPYLRHIPVEQY